MIVFVVAVAVKAYFGWRLLRRRCLPTDEAWKLGYEIGWEHGHQEGRRAARPVVVPMHKERHGVPAEVAVREVASHRPPA